MIAIVSVALVSSVAGGAYVSSLSSQPQASVEDNAIVNPDASPVPTPTFSHGSTLTALTPSPTPKPWHDFTVVYGFTGGNSTAIVVNMNVNGFCFTSPINSEVPIDAFTLCINGTIRPTHVYSSRTAFSMADLNSLNGTNRDVTLQVTYTFDTVVSPYGFRESSVPVLSYNGPYSVSIIPSIT